MVVLAKCAKGDCSALRAPAISAGIRNPGFRPAYSCWLWLSDVQTALRASTRSVCPPDNTFGAKKNSCLLFFKETEAKLLRYHSYCCQKNSLSIPSFFKYEKLTGNTLTGVNRTSLLGTLSVVSSGRIVCNAVSAAFHQPAAL